MEDFEKAPTDLSIKAKMEYVLETELKQDEDLLNSLTKLISSVKATEDYKTYVSQVGDNNISIAGKIDNSTINIQK